MIWIVQDFIKHLVVYLPDGTGFQNLAEAATNKSIPFYAIDFYKIAF